MNERIRELAQEAYDYALIYDNSMYGEVYDKKFAELIVRECLSYAKDGDLDFMKFMIKRNFGVEE